MRMIVPIDVNDAVLVDCNIAETDHAAWNSGTAYSIGDRVIVVSTHSIYESIQAGANHDPVTDTALETPLWWVRVGATNRWRAFDDVIQDQAVKTGGITYELDVTSRSDGIALFGLDAESVTVQVSDPLIIRRNLIDATEQIENPYWSDVPGSFIGGLTTDPDGGSTARIINFPAGGTVDNTPTLVASAGLSSTSSVWIRSDTVTTIKLFFGTNAIEYEDVAVTPSWVRVQSSGVLIANYRFRLECTSGGDVEVWHPQLELGDTPTDYQSINTSGDVLSFAYDQTRDLQDYSDIEDYWTYFFNPIIKLDSVVFSGVPAFSGTTVYISINSDGDAKVGEIALGQDFYLGKVHAGAAVGIQDFSRKERDTFGNWVIIERAYSDTMDLNFSFDATKTGYVRRLLADRRAMPTVFHNGEGFEQYGLLTYGFYKDINLPIVTQALCVASLEIEGLT